MSWNISLKWKLAYKYSWVLLTRIDVLIYPSGRHCGESGTVGLTWGLVQKAATPVSLKISRLSEAQYPPSPSYVGANYYLWTEIPCFFILFTTVKRLFLPIAGGVGGTFKGAFRPKSFYDSVIPPSFQFPLIFLPRSLRVFSLCSQAVFWACFSISSLRELAKVCREATAKNPGPRNLNFLLTVYQSMVGTLNKPFLPPHGVCDNNASREQCVLPRTAHVTPEKHRLKWGQVTFTSDQVWKPAEDGRSLQNAMEN